MDLSQSVIAITGAAQGLGLAMAQYLADKHAKLALIDLNPEKLAEAKQTCLHAGSPQVETYEINVADEKQVEDLFADIPKTLGGLNGLINNAGILRDGLLIRQKDGEIQKLSLSHWQSVIDVNLTGVFLCGRECAYQMINHQQQGCIINISSISRSGNMGQSNYSAAKAGVASLATVWSKELAPHGIRCNAIAPGFIESDMTASIRPEIIEKMKKGIPMGRMGQAQEIAHTVAFLLENDYMSGRIVEVDGGLRL
ncbi:SDR family oxidoreductase [Bermanella marisrubri]|uniref:Short-chain alcohol dehydrogenase-like protein n=1 Tax=Bermanella marisrubri TaxID=207949 RepID=Q1MXR9_9GAMM|nr:SDR family oxidoreductase [Bermanella marisrubri]EAT10782.1 short-chain alcohol dehydrogenase-like protein [Oceanobacter sp. RED65] [Bermanella marisrubri]QIZ83489.1 SDR family oxidoreductase [Bermanella marisrubri]